MMTCRCGRLKTPAGAANEADVNAISKQERGVYGLLALAVVIYGLYFSLYQIQRHRAFWTGVDLVSVEQPIWNTLHGDFMRATYYPITGEPVSDFSERTTDSLLADHVQPFLLLLALPYALAPRSETLLVLMSVSVGLGAIPLFRIARRKFGSPWWALLFAVGYLLLPAVETNSGWDIHATIFLPTLMLAAFDALQSGKRGWWWFWTLLAMGCREDIPLLLGWAMLWLAPRERRREAGLMFALGLLLSLGYFTVVIPFFGGGGTPYLTRFFPLGTNITGEGIRDVLREPAFWRRDLIFFLGYNIRLGLPLLFLYCLHWPSLLAMAPLLLLNGLSWYEFTQYPNLFHYSAPIIAWAWIGTLEGVVRLERWLLARRPRFHWRSVLGEMLAVSVVVSHFVMGYTPLSRMFVWPALTGRESVMEALLAQIPENAAVSAESHLAAHLAQRETLRFFPDLRDADWLVMDVWPGEYFYLTHVERWQAVLSDACWETVAAHEGVILLRRGSGPPQGIEGAFRPAPGTSVPELGVRFGTEGQSLTLRGLEIFPRFGGSMVICTDWVREGEGELYPRIGLVGRGSSSTKSLDGTRFYPALFAGPREIRECTKLLALGNTAEIIVQLAMADQAGQHYYTPTLLDAGEWGAGRIWIEETTLFLRVRPGE